MAISASSPHTGVRAGINGEPGMVEGRPGPGSRVVAQSASGGEGSRHVVRVGGALVIRLVTGVAVGGRGRVVSVDMATGARHAHVRSGEGEAGGAVVKTGRDPGGGVVAHLALLRKAGSDVVRIGCAVEILEVARDTQRAQVREHPAHVATLALQRGMRAGKGEAGSSVIESGIRPRGRAVADRAIRGETGGLVVGVGRLQVIRQVTSGAARTLQREVAVDMAL